MTTLIYFTLKNIGCYADGAFGHKHIRETLVREIETLRQRTGSRRFDSQKMHDMLVALRGEMSDDASEEDEAIDVLNEYCADGVHFSMIDGDLMLTNSTEE